MSPKLALWWLISLLALNLTGCASLSKEPAQPEMGHSILLSSANAIGQSFIAQFDGFNGVSIYLKPVKRGSGQILFHLRESPQKEGRYPNCCNGSGTDKNQRVLHICVSTANRFGFQIVYHALRNQRRWGIPGWDKR